MRLVNSTGAPRGSTNVRSAASSTMTTATTPTTISSDVGHDRHRAATPRPARGGRRGPLALADRRFCSTRARFDDRDGRVATRGGSTCSAAASRSRSRSSASSRFWSCERRSDATIRTAGPSLSSSRARWRGPSDGDASMSKRSSTRVFDVLACWPPGPPERAEAPLELVERDRARPRDPQHAVSTPRAYEADARPGDSSA